MNKKIKQASTAFLAVLLVTMGIYIIYAATTRTYPFKAKPSFTLVQAFSDASATTEYSLTQTDLGTINNATTQILYIKNSGSQQASVTLTISAATNCNVFLNNTNFLLNPDTIEPVGMTIYFTGTAEATWNLEVNG